MEKVNENQNNPNKKNPLILVAAAILLTIVCLACLQSEPEDYTYVQSIAGVTVYSQIPLEDLAFKQSIALYNASGRIETTCNFEISALSENNPNGYKVSVEDGGFGVYIDRNQAKIMGETDSQTLHACNVFNCLREEITCPGNMWDIREIILDEREINIAIDTKVAGEGAQGYGEILGAIGYLQSKYASTDFNGDGKLDGDELNRSIIKIFPYLKEGDNCTIQPMMTSLQVLNASNKTVPCSSLSPAIILENSDINQITLIGKTLTVTGDDAHINSASVIVRDLLSPEFIRRLYRLE